MGRGRFESVVAALQTTEHNLWKSMKYVVFDLPNLESPYELRIQELKRMKFPLHVFVVDAFRCLDNNHMLESLDTIVKEGGEGLMMMEPGSHYFKGRTQRLLKVKVPIS